FRTRKKGNGAHDRHERSAGARRRARLCRERLLLALMALGPLLWLGGSLLTNAIAALRQRRIVTDHLFLLALSGALAASLHATWRGRGFVFYELVPLLLAIHRLGALLLTSPRERLDATSGG